MALQARYQGEHHIGAVSGRNDRRDPGLAILGPEDFDRIGDGSADRVGMRDDPRSTADALQMTLYGSQRTVPR